MSIDGRAILFVFSSPGNVATVFLPARASSYPALLLHLTDLIPTSAVSDCVRRGPWKGATSPADGAATPATASIGRVSGGLEPGGRAMYMSCKHFVIAKCCHDNDDR